MVRRRRAAACAEASTAREHGAAASGQGVTTTDFVASAPYVFVATVPVELPSVGAVQALSLFVAGADPQDGPGEPSMPLMAAG